MSDDDHKGRFHRRWGQSGTTFPCRQCGRRTRSVDQASPDLCSECDEWTAIENGINDGAYPAAGDLAAAEARIAKLKRQAIKKGGDAERLRIHRHQREGE